MSGDGWRTAIWYVLLALLCYNVIVAAWYRSHRGRAEERLEERCCVATRKVLVKCLEAAGVGLYTVDEYLDMADFVAHGVCDP